MHGPRPHRRAIFTSLLAAVGVTAPGLALAQIDVFELRAFAAGAPADNYVPPTGLKALLDLYRRMTGPVTLNGAGPFAFVVDTGANQSVISAELAAQLALPPGHAEELHGVAGVQTTQTVNARL
ncbi:MAG TPA: aspartyl protease family protein, partial [Caulobacteraceae bacterium]|nr:aspartyl protease family protein [Caulobacteraceae bacterium]